MREIYMLINYFTKKELQTIYSALSIISDASEYAKALYYPTAIKIRTMIDNYCEHDWENTCCQCSMDSVCCHKCEKRFTDE